MNERSKDGAPAAGLGDLQQFQKGEVPTMRNVLKRVAVLKALANPTRLEITEALLAGELCVNQLRDIVGMDVSTVSKHLSILRSAGVVNSEKRGLNVYYALACECFGEFLQCADQVCVGTGVPGLKKTSCC